MAPALTAALLLCSFGPLAAETQVPATDAAMALAGKAKIAKMAETEDQALLEAGRVLDALHLSAKTADWDRYFSLYSQDALFLGTDADERWGMAELEQYARPTKGWRYDVMERHLLRHAEVIVFDERLSSLAYGACRSSGTLIHTLAGWKLLQYHLSFPIPNEMAKEITAQLKRHDGNH
ncbi:nuclear transport factor 2 family protein [Shewanella sp. SHSM-M6]|uniref:Nuclear transport factor 2 family protein n=2 Tax=Shewanella salipaludis TaxID=2723052 RepID=A0A972JJT1_9GAMM|nr:nuclear transport factor 2 family protein [Shewanella salipaludis]